MGKVRAPDPLGLLTLGSTTTLGLQSSPSKAEEGMESISPKERHRNQETYVLKNSLRSAIFSVPPVSHFQSKSINI